MDIKTIADARRQGFHVKVNHYRFRDVDIRKVHRFAYVLNSREQARLAQTFGIEPFHSSQFLNGKDISSLGGVTEVLLEKDGACYLGSSHCSLVDNYERANGVRRAFRRAVSALKHKITI